MDLSSSLRLHFSKLNKQFPQSFPIHQASQVFDCLCDPSLDPFQPVHIFYVQPRSKLNALLILEFARYHLGTTTINLITDSHQNYLHAFALSSTQNRVILSGSDGHHTGILTDTWVLPQV